MLSDYAAPVKPPVEIITAILDKLSFFYPLSESLKKAFINKSFELRINKGEHLVKQGEYCRHFYFLVEGVVAGCRKRGQHQIVTFICLSGDIISAIEGMYGLSPSADGIFAAEDCYLVALNAADLLEFLAVYVEMNVVMRKILENYYIQAHERAVVSRMGNAQEKYAYFLEKQPGHVDRVATELVASFLDMKPETLNRIKAQSLKVSPGVNTQLIDELEKLMSEELLFGYKRLSSKLVAEHLGTSVHQLSYLLNDHYKMSFSDFVNNYRVEYVKEQLATKSNFEQTTIESLGGMAGFSSKSTFFAAFKKHTGLSPLAYAKEITEFI